MSIADVTDKSNPISIAIATYPSVAYTHQGWLTDDHRYFYLNDEIDEAQDLVEGTRTLIWDFADLDDPVLAGEYVAETTETDHNLYVKGDLMYQSNTAAGLRILDITNREEPVEVAYFDTSPRRGARCFVEQLSLFRKRENCGNGRSLRPLHSEEEGSRHIAILTRLSAGLNRNVLTLCRARVDLTRPVDSAVRVIPHLDPLGDPSGHPTPSRT